MAQNEIVKFKGGSLQKIANIIGVTNNLLNIDLRKINALHFDDHSIFLKGMQISLKRSFPNLAMQSFTNSELALCYLENCFKENIRINLIITGLNQRPDIDGYEFAKAIRKIERTFNKKVIILIVSMYDKEFPLIKTGLAEKIFDEYFPKSVSIAEIFNCIKTLVK